AGWRSECGPCSRPLDAGGPGEQAHQILVQPGQDRTLDRDRHGLDGLGVALSMDDERAHELLRALVGGRQSPQGEYFPRLRHGAILTQWSSRSTSGPRQRARRSMTVMVGQSPVAPTRFSTRRGWPGTAE